MKILITLDVPSIETSYDIFVPDDLPVREVTGLLARGVEELSWKQYVASGTEFLCSAADETCLDPDKSLYTLGAQNGDRYLLI